MTYRDAKNVSLTPYKLMMSLETQPVCTLRSKVANNLTCLTQTCSQFSTRKRVVELEVTVSGQKVEKVVRRQSFSRVMPVCLDGVSQKSLTKMPHSNEIIFTLL